jgi:hypothetical protein
MPDSDVEKAFLAAAEIAKKLPKNLQVAGFNLAVEQLMGKIGGNPAAGRARETAGRALKASKQGIDIPEYGALFNAINRTKHPDVGATPRVADRALKVLEVAHKEHGVDGLTADQIAKILSEKFRLPTKANSVAKALVRETSMVDVRGGVGGTSRVFHIMEPGEAYLTRLRSGDEGGGSRGATAMPSARPAKSHKSRSRKKASARAKAPKEKSIGKRAAGRPGPKAAIEQLLGAGFFSSARTISAIADHLRDQWGHSYSVQELSPALIRSVRDKSLKRSRDKAGQYEYNEA